MNTNTKQVVAEVVTRAFEKQAVLINTAFETQKNYFEGRFEKIDNRLDKIGVRLDNVETRLDRVEDRLTGVETKLDKALYSEIPRLDKRIDKAANKKEPC